MKHAIKKMAKGGSMDKMMKDKGAKAPAIAIMIGVAKPKAKTKMATGGMAMVEKDGKKVPAFAADGKGKMAMGGLAKAPIKKPAPAPIKQLVGGPNMAPPNAPKGPSKLGSKFNKGGMAKGKS